MKLTIEQAVRRFEAEAEMHRQAGRHTTAHEWEKRIAEVGHLAYLAEALPPAPYKSRRWRRG